MSYLVFVSVFMISPNCVGVVWCQIQNKAARENSCSTSSYDPPRTVRVSTTISILLYELPTTISLFLYEFLRHFPSYCTSSYDTFPVIDVSEFPLFRMCKMGRHYQKKGVLNMDRTGLDAAFKHRVSTNCSLRKAANMFGVKATTLQVGKVF